MRIDDNFFEPCAGHLFDPVLKLQLRAVPGPEAPPSSAGLVLFYHPDLRTDDFEVPPADPAGHQAAVAKNCKHLQDVLSREIVAIISGRLFISFNVVGSALIMSVEEDGRNLSYFERDIARTGIPVISEQPRAILLYALKSLVKVSELKPRYGSTLITKDTHRIEMRIRESAATKFFELEPSEYDPVDGGWACVASREIRQ